MLMLLPNMFAFVFRLFFSLMGSAQEKRLLSMLVGGGRGLKLSRRVLIQKIPNFLLQKMKMIHEEHPLSWNDEREAHKSRGQRLINTIHRINERLPTTTAHSHFQFTAVVSKSAVWKASSSDCLVGNDDHKDDEIQNNTCNK